MPAPDQVAHDQLEYYSTQEPEIMTRVTHRVWLQSIVGATLAVILALPSAFAGPGHDHGPAASSATAPASPRVTATSENYQFVGIVEGEVLVIYLDRFADNAPVTKAQIEVTIGDKVIKAEQQPKGTYEVASPILKMPGLHEVLVNIVEGQTSDLLVSSVRIGAAADTHGNGGIDHSIWSHVVAAKPSLKTLGHFMGGAFLLGGLGMLFGRKNRLTAAALALVGVLVVASSSAMAGPGHDHGPEPGGATNGNAPQRQPDGNIFLPKPSQRLLEIRTRVVAPETANRAVRFVGRVVPNPNKSGVVQSTVQGRFIPPPDGVLTIGTRVKQGDLLGSVAPSFVSKETSDMAQTLGEIDQQISLLRSKLGRQETLFKTNVVAKAAVDETRIQLDGYVKRRQDLLASRVQPEELRAPVDGVITSAKVVAGQVVSQTDQLFNIVDPASLMVEALVFDQIQAEAIENVVATVNEQVSAKLRFLGRSRALQQQYSVLKFEVLEPSPALNIGTPVTVTGRAGAPVTTIILPKAAVAQAPNGQMVVFLHKEPEIFEPKAIRFEPFDAQSVMILGGVDKGDKIVVEGAPLINQVR